MRLVLLVISRVLVCRVWCVEWMSVSGTRWRLTSSHAVCLFTSRHHSWSTHVSPVQKRESSKMDSDLCKGEKKPFPLALCLSLSSVILILSLSFPLPPPLSAFLLKCTAWVWVEQEFGVPPLIDLRSLSWEGKKSRNKKVKSESGF